jgi:hypothetical protein
VLSDMVLEREQKNWLLAFSTAMGQAKERN